MTRSRSASAGASGLGWGRATNAYFPQVMRVISIAELDADLKKAVEQLLAEIRSRKAPPAAAPAKSIKQAEMGTLFALREETGQDALEGDFFARRLRLEDDPKGPMAPVKRVVLVHRLREVMAQVGFTRFEVDMPEVEGIRQAAAGAAGHGCESGASASKSGGCRDSHADTKH